MPEDKPAPPKPSLSPDSLIQGILSRIGGIFDSITGRGKKSSSLATSEIAARAKKMLDSRMRDMGENGRFVPHLIELKVEWGKFNTDAPGALKNLENEILAALLDHINDHRYLTYAPLKVTTKPDYFVQGVHIITSFGEKEKEDDEVDLSVTMPNINVKELLAKVQPKPEKPLSETVFARFNLLGMEKDIRLRFEPGDRLNVGRTRENDLMLEDGSVSKLHAALSINSAGELLVADTGSTNGTFINNGRLAYGKAFTIKDSDMVTFGNVNVFFERIAPDPEPESAQDVIIEPAGAVETVEVENEGPVKIAIHSIPTPAEMPELNEVKIAEETDPDVTH